MFASFYFEDLKLSIELDGTQHNKTLEYDATRDANILFEHGVYIYRISHKEYKSGIKIDEVRNLLSMNYNKRYTTEVDVIYSVNIKSVLSNDI